MIGISKQSDFLRSGFTLIELLVVIAIIAILSVVVILTLNPAELLRQARDANRISDLSTVKTALGVYYADVSSPTTTKSYSWCYMSALTSAPTPSCGFTGPWTATSSPLRGVDGTGWIPVNFTSISSGAPMGNLPADPLNTVNSNNVYRYAANATSTYEINALLESTKQAATTGAMYTDGGNNNALYESGSAAGLAL